MVLFLGLGSAAGLLVIHRGAGSTSTCNRYSGSSLDPLMTTTEGPLINVEVSLALSESLPLRESSPIQLLVAGSGQTLWPGPAALA